MTARLYDGDLDPENGGEQHRRLVAEVERLRVDSANAKATLANARELLATVERRHDDVCRGYTREVAALKTDNERLRGLVKSAERDGFASSSGFVSCPWCEAEGLPSAVEAGRVPHAADCPAFTPDGTAR